MSVAIVNTQFSKTSDLGPTSNLPGGKALIVKQYFNEGGGIQRDFCRRHNISEGSFSRWKKDYLQAQSGEGVDKKTSKTFSMTQQQSVAPSLLQKRSAPEETSALISQQLPPNSSFTSAAVGTSSTAKHSDEQNSTGTSHTASCVPAAVSPISNSSDASAKCNKLCRHIDHCVDLLTSKPLHELVARPQYKALASKLIHDVDWTWTASLSATQRAALPLYQLFLLCKIVAEDFSADGSSGRLQLSPTPLLDGLWHAHLLRPGKYLEMHKLLGLTKIMDHTPQSARDNDEEKVLRLKELKDYMLFLVPSLGEMKLRDEFQEESNAKRAKTSGEFRATPLVDKVIALKLQSVDGVQTPCLVSLSTEMKQVFASYAKQRNQLANALEFRFKGKVIQSQDTPRSLKLQDNDVIEVTDRLVVFALSTPSGEKTLFKMRMSQRLRVVFNVNVLTGICDIFLMVISFVVIKLQRNWRWKMMMSSMWSHLNLVVSLALNACYYFFGIFSYGQFLFRVEVKCFLC
jgi:hypothetical protein